MAKGQKGVSVVMCVERVIGNLMDSANGFHARKPDLDVKQENNNPQNNKVFCSIDSSSYKNEIHITIRLIHTREFDERKFKATLIFLKNLNPKKF